MELKYWFYSLEHTSSVSDSIEGAKTTVDAEDQREDTKFNLSWIG
ncbi:30450_t:CDS:2 [Gigaspora margarita]|uniref:30450_t:CDS:1 n=1 Tax=Gigaspora margarita TaxID=4874 RepID=A0ABM8W7A8_GIGMA|nr:30450_t:CDS:2 [Gigaspora margarita]